LILAFDPGHTTGIAVLTDEHASVVRTWALGIEDAKVRIRTLAHDHPDAVVVAEAPPEWGGNNRGGTQQVEEAIRTAFPDTVWVNPGQWKGTPASRIEIPEWVRTVHEKDAVKLGRWFKSTKRRQGVGTT
jgi:hypothetical protein